MIEEDIHDDLGVKKTWSDGDRPTMFDGICILH